MFALVDSAPVLLVSLGSMLLAGVVLMLPERMWLAGIGFLVGSAMTVVIAVAIGAILVAQHTV